MGDGSRKREGRERRRLGPAATSSLAGLAIVAFVTIFTGPPSVSAFAFICIGASLVALQIYVVLAFPGRMPAFFARLGLLLITVLALPAVVAGSFPSEVPASVGMPMMLVTTWLSISIAIWGVIAAVISQTSKRTREFVVAAVAGVLAAANFVGFMTQFDRVGSPVTAVANLQFPDDNGISTQAGHSVILTIQIDDNQALAHSTDGSTVEFEVPIYYESVRVATAVDNTVVQASDPWVEFQPNRAAIYLDVLRALLSFGVVLPEPVLTLGMIQPLAR